MIRLTPIALLLALAAAPAVALDYETIVTWVEANQGGTSTNLYAAIAEGNTVYCQLALGSGNRITRVNNTNLPIGSRTTTELVTQAQWTAASGGVNLVSFYGFSMSGQNLQFTDSTSDAVWRVNKSTGAITPYITKAQIAAYTGGSGPSSLTGADTAPDGEFTWYEGQTNQILKSTGQGTMMTFISYAQLYGLNTNVAATSMSWAPDGTFFWTNSSSDEVYKRDTAGNLSRILDVNNIKAVTGGTSVNFKDIFAAPDGKVYFQEQSSSHILRFDPADPVNSLAIYLSATDLTSGPAAGASGVYQLSWYDGRLAFNYALTTGARGFYAVVPEPATLGLLLLSGLTLLRRRCR